MKLRAVLELGLLALALPSTASAAASWGFGEASITIQGKAAAATGKQPLSDKTPLKKPLVFGSADTLKLLLTTQQNGSPKLAHQSFLLLKDPVSGLDISYPLSVKENGKAKLELKQKDLPTQLLKASKPLEARVLVGSFGSAKAYDGQAFRLRIDLDPSEALPSEKALRYGKLPEIHHIFRSDPKSPPVIISLFFLVVVLAALPALAIAWLTLGANANHLPVALKSSPVSHILFVGSIVGLEGIFYLYYTTWNLFQILPAVAVVGTVTFLSGSRALGEVQERRLAGLR